MSKAVKIGKVTYLYGDDDEHGKRFWKAALMNLLKGRFVSKQSFDMWWNVLIEKTT